ncbi:MAG: GAF domain-containing protein [Nostoc sp. ChiSLP01]|nr:GAF domain-containing protein [Nostoc sp. CmiSLP01]MDZ8285928.1 GAF domain-containing protein [Nostoc sp. ChiSLP01]
MNQPDIPAAIANIIESSPTPDVLFSELLPAVVEFLQCDRCFLYLHHPQLNLGKVAFCWVRTPDIPTIYNENWEPQPLSFSDEDPMFAAALGGKPSIFVEDVETADSQVLNHKFEQENFGHRALIHAHIQQDGQLWGVLQPSIFGHPRIWTEYERVVINNIVQKITPLTVNYVKSAFD